MRDPDKDPATYDNLRRYIDADLAKQQRRGLLSAEQVAEGRATIDEALAREPDSAGKLKVLQGFVLEVLRARQRARR
jgi:hypothetical protein